MRECPSCGLEVAGHRESCPKCLATLVDDADATVTCSQCGRVCPSRMHSCPGCMALLRPDPEEARAIFADAIGRGRRLHRPFDRRPFEDGPGCSVLRLVPNGGLVLCGMSGVIEAGVEGNGIVARAPLTCTTAGAVLFRLERYTAAERSLVAIGADGAALGTYLHAGGPLDVSFDIRDESSAPVARFEPARFGYQIVRTGGGVIGSGDRRDEELDGWVDDQWSVTPRTSDLPMEPLGFIAIALAAKVLYGRPKPVELPPEKRRDREDDDGDFTLKDLLF